jgi:hypothetical protein
MSSIDTSIDEELKNIESEIVNFITHNSQGKILRYGLCARQDILLQARDNEYVMEGVADDLENYIDQEEIKLRPEMKLATTSHAFPINTTFCVDSIPSNTLLSHPEGELSIDDGYFEWSTNTPGDYVFTLTNFPYKDEVIHATVTSA